jgi:hypothetical protein
MLSFSFIGVQHILMELVSIFSVDKTEGADFETLSVTYKTI